MDAGRKQASRDRGSRSVSHSPRKVSMEKEGSKSDSEGGLLLANPNACEEDSPTSPRQTAALPDKPKPLKSRPKSPSFLRMLVGSFRSKQSTGEGSEELRDQAGTITSTTTVSPPSPVATVPTIALATAADCNSLSDPEELLSPIDKTSDRDRHREIEHLATLPRRPERKKKKKRQSEKAQQDAMSPQERSGSSKADPVYEHIPDRSSANGDIVEGGPQDRVQTEDYHSGGLEALETLHNQLQILVHQECEHEIAESFQIKVVTSLQQQLDDLQRSLDCLQESDKNLRLALKMGEMKCRETEIKYQLTSDRCLRLEQRNRRLDHKYRLLLRQHKELEKHLQKKAVLNQMMEQQSPGRIHRPQSAREHTRRSSHEYVPKSATLSVFTSPVKRHNSTDGLHTLPGATPSSSLPRGHSGSFSHTETRV